MPKDWSVYYCVILIRNSSMEGISKYLSKPSKEPKYRAERTHADFLSPLENHIDLENLQDFADVIKLPYVVSYNRHAWFLYAVLVNNCDAVEEYCKSKGIDLRRSWPLPIHKQPIYRDIIGNASYPVAEEVSPRILNLPMYYAMTQEEQDYVIKHLKDAVKR